MGITVSRIDYSNSNLGRLSIDGLESVLNKANEFQYYSIEIRELKEKILSGEIIFSSDDLQIINQEISDNLEAGNNYIEIAVSY